MCVFVYVCVCVCVYVCMCVCVCVCVYIYIHIFTPGTPHSYTHTHTNTHEFTADTPQGLRLASQKNFTAFYIFIFYLRQIHRTVFDWPVNYTALSPDGKLACVVGDSTEAILVDLR